MVTRSQSSSAAAIILKNREFSQIGAKFLTLCPLC